MFNTTTTTGLQVAVDGHTAVVTGMQYQHRSSCPWCRRTIVLTSEAGRILTGIKASRTGKTVRWYTHHTAHPVHVPERCPECGHDRWARQVQGGFEFNHPNHVTASTRQGYLSQLGRVYSAIRAEYPQLAAAADQRQGSYRLTVTPTK